MPASDVAAVRRRLRHLVSSYRSASDAPGYTLARSPLSFADQEARTVDHVYTLDSREAGREARIGTTTEVRHEVTVTLATAWYDGDAHDTLDSLASDAERLVSLISAEPNYSLTFGGETCPDYHTETVRSTSTVRADNGPVAVVQVRFDAAYELDAPPVEFDVDGHLVIPV